MENRFENTPYGGSEQSPASHHAANPGTEPLPTAPLGGEQTAGAAAGEGASTPNWTYASTGTQQPAGSSQNVGYQQAPNRAAGAQGASGASPYASNPYASQAYTYQPASPASARGTSAKSGSAAKFGKTFLAGFLGAALACAVGIGGFAAWQSTTAATSGSTVLGGSGGSIEVSGGEATLAEAVSQKVLPSVVNIDVYTQQSSGLYGMFGMYGSGNGGSEETLSSLGSGVIISQDGYILTNQHVVSGADKLMVTLSDGNQYEATVVGEDASSDLAVVKVDANEALTAIEIGDSSNLTVGEWVMTAGSPYGLEQSVATGIVSATNRSSVLQNEGGTAYYTNMIQTDAAINPGNSGGPTFNAAGQVIGINSSIASTASSSGTAGSIGIGFAIPSNLVKRVTNEIIDNGSVKHVVLGITIKSSSVEADGVTRGCAQVQAVTDGGPASKAGVKAGDSIVAFNGKAVNNNYSLLGYVRASAMGDKVKLTVVRGGNTMDLEVTLDQEETKTNSSNKQEQRQQNNGNDDNGNGQNGGSQNGQNGGNGNNGDGGGLFDPFGLW